MRKRRSDLSQDLRHVLWIGGGTDTGKTSIARTVAARHGLQLYHFDQHEPDHIDRLIKAGSVYYRNLVIKNAAGRWDLRDIEEYWVRRSPAVMAEDTICGWKERFPLVIEDLKAMPAQPMIIAEGPGLFPENVHPLLESWHQAVWLVPDEPFKRMLVEKRNKPSVRAQTSNPQRATKNLIGRDLYMARKVWEEAQALGLKVILIDGTQSLDEVTAYIEQHFISFLCNNVRQ